MTQQHGRGLRRIEATRRADDDTIDEGTLIAWAQRFSWNTDYNSISNNDRADDVLGHPVIRPEVSIGGDLDRAEESSWTKVKTR